MFKYGAQLGVIPEPYDDPVDGGGDDGGGTIAPYSWLVGTFYGAVPGESLFVSLFGFAIYRRAGMQYEGSVDGATIVINSIGVVYAQPINNGVRLSGAFTGNYLRTQTADDGSGNTVVCDQAYCGAQGVPMNIDGVCHCVTPVNPQEDGNGTPQTTNAPGTNAPGNSPIDRAVNFAKQNPLFVIGGAVLAFLILKDK